MKSIGTRTMLTIMAICVTLPLAHQAVAKPENLKNKAEAANARLPVKVMIVTMFAAEAKPWLERLGADRAIDVAGLSPEYPAVRCNADQVCVITTGAGHTNAAATMAALVFSGRFDLRRTFFLISGIAGMNPAQGTLGSVAWARYLVDFGLQWELDAREIPTQWQSGYLGIHTTDATQKPELKYKTEVYRLNEPLLQWALKLSQNVSLSDSEGAERYRALYVQAPANRPPSVIQCDTTSGDTWFSGKALGERAQEWTGLLTDGKGRYCTTQQEDNATFEVLKRATSAGLADMDRVAVMRAGSDFDRPPPGVSNLDNLLNYTKQGGFEPAIENLYRVGSPLVHAIVRHWSSWRDGVPMP